MKKFFLIDIIECASPDPYIVLLQYMDTVELYSIIQSLSILFVKDLIIFYVHKVSRIGIGLCIQIEDIMMTSSMNYSFTP